MKSYSGETREFYNKEIPKKGSNYTFLTVISLDVSLK